MITANEKDLQILIKAAHAGGKQLRKYFGQALSLVEKSTIADFQTKADLESEKSILKILKSKFPSYNILSEEEGKTMKDSDYTLVVDPLDGTNNFVLGIPNFCVSIALLYKNRASLGVIFQPILDQTYYATVGGGAFLNAKPIKVNNVTNHKNLTIAHSCNYNTNRSHVGNTFSALFKSDHKRITDNWSVAYDYCLLASGKIESFITNNTEIHDFAAGKLIALEAGAKIIDFSGKKEKNYTNSKFILSNMDKINKYVFKTIKPYISK